MSQASARQVYCAAAFQWFKCNGAVLSGGSGCSGGADATNADAQLVEPQVRSARGEHIAVFVGHRVGAIGRGTVGVVAAVGFSSRGVDRRIELCSGRGGHTEETRYGKCERGCNGSSINHILFS